MPFVIDRLQPGDLDAGLRLSTQAGWNQLAADWQRVVELCPDGCLAGRLDGRLVATGSVAAIGENIRWIGMILVDEAMRGQGFGSIMMDRCMDIARGAGGRIVGLDASDLGRPLYLRKGFVDVAPIDRWTGVLKVDGDPAAVVTGDPGELKSIARLDQIACGVDRAPLLRQMLQDPGAVVFLAQNKGLAGYAILVPGRMSPHLGPVVARDEATWRELLSAAARHLAGREVIVDAMRTAVGTALLEGCGLTVARKLTRMTLSKSHPVLWGPLVRAVVSFTWG